GLRRLDHAHGVAVAEEPGALLDHAVAGFEAVEDLDPAVDARAGGHAHAVHDPPGVDGEHVGVAVALHHRGGRHGQRVAAAGDDAALDVGARLQRAGLGQVGVDGAGAGPAVDPGA